MFSSLTLFNSSSLFHTLKLQNSSSYQILIKKISENLIGSSPTKDGISASYILNTNKDSLHKLVIAFIDYFFDEL
jgi:hypothetical protein